MSHACASFYTEKTSGMAANPQSQAHIGKRKKNPAPKRAKHEKSRPRKGAGEITKQELFKRRLAENLPAGRGWGAG
jgi:hypothetical protein